MRNGRAASQNAHGGRKNAKNVECFVLNSSPKGRAYADREENKMNTYQTRGTCSRAIEYEVENGVVTACRFIGGCAGNTQGVAALVVGMPVDEAIRRLKGLQCRNGTSCPDQLATALSQYVAQQAN